MPHQYKPFTPSVVCTCEGCGKEFRRVPSGVGKFCSHSCYNLSRKVAHACERCGKIFHRKASRPGRFCSRSCKETETVAVTAARFWSYVDKSDDCWLWTASVYHQGYGRFTVEGHPISAHRWSYESAYGPIPAGLIVCHSCDVRACVNPAHLFLGNAHTNKQDEVMKGRHVRGERCHSAKLTADQVIAIRRLHATTTTTQIEIARRYGVLPEAIGRIVRRQTWQHI